MFDITNAVKRNNYAALQQTKVGQLASLSAYFAGSVTAFGRMMIPATAEMPHWHGYCGEGAGSGGICI
ncbi:MAG: hypothetical protein ABIQ66_05660 [Novosphingobium sp.]